MAQGVGREKPICREDADLLKLRQKFLGRVDAT
jgi:hypothetical protein